MNWVKSIDDLYDFIGYVVLRAPDRFPVEDFLRPDEQMNLQKAFAELNSGLAFVEEEVVGRGNKLNLKILLDAALAAYQVRDVRGGAHKLQDFERLIFKT